MIGQAELKNQIDKLIDKGFPKFVIITGQKGQGKKELAKYIINKLKYHSIWLENNKIDTIREMIQVSYKQTEPIIYIIADADNMSIGAKNSLLKILEEPPQNAFFIMTLKDINNTLKTIQSRCIELKLNNYTDIELNKFIAELIPDITSEERCVIDDICTNYYQIQLLVKYGIIEFYEFVEKVVNNIYRVRSANSFKLCQKLDIKNDNNGYDINLFFETFKSICLQLLLELIDNEDEIELFKNYGNSISITSKYQNKLSVNGINIQSLLDNWILDIRRVWKD